MVQTMKGRQYRIKIGICYQVALNLYYFTVQASKCVEDFGVAVEQLLIRHGKGIIGKIKISPPPFHLDIT